jgi:hypothetical protein
MSWFEFPIRQFGNAKVIVLDHAVNSIPAQQSEATKRIDAGHNRIKRLLPKRIESGMSASNALRTRCAYDNRGTS